MISCVERLQLPETIWEEMTSDLWCLSIFWHQLPVSLSLSVSQPACPSLLSSQPRNWLRGGEGELWGGVHGGWQRSCQPVVSEVAPIKSRCGRRAAQTFSAQLRPADRDARYGAHVQRAALLPGVVPVCPQGRLQIYRGKCRGINKTYSLL